MAVKAAPPPAPLPMIYDWTGFYIGGNGGWGHSYSCLNFVDVFGFDFADGCRSRSGGLVGGQIGYRWQAGTWVFGLEAQGDWADLSNTRVSPFFDQFNPLPGLTSTRFKTDGKPPLHRPDRLRLECSAVLTRGAARRGRQSAPSILDTFTGIELASASATRWAAPSVLDLSTASHRTGRSVLKTTTCSWAMLTIRSRVSIRVLPLLPERCITQDVDMVTARINYRFGGYGAPVAAKSTSRYFDFSSRRGRQKCRPFCWRLHV